MLKLKSAQFLRVKKPNLFHDLKKGVFFLIKLGVEMGVVMGGALKCLVG